MSAKALPSPGAPSRRIVAFYGFKGGAGRSLLLANTAALLAAAGRRVLVIDADLEAPGLGDFFDTEGGMLFSEWRLREGFVDFMKRLMETGFEIPNGAVRIQALSDKIGAQLFDDNDEDSDLGGKRYLSDVPMRPYESSGDDGTPQTFSEGKLYLMGSGSHRLSSTDGSFSFVARTLDLDWNTMIQGKRAPVDGREMFSALRASLLSGKDFDDVLIDGRTGYNAASLITIQNLATDVVMVGTSSMQSIDGIARMRPLFTGPDSQPTGIRAHLVLSKMSGSKPDPEHRATREEASKRKQELNRLYHPDHDPWDFPFVEDFVTGDSLIFRRVGLIDVQDDNAILYKRRLLKFAQEVTGAPIPFDEALLHRAFARWGRDTKGRSTRAQDFERTSAQTDEAIAESSEVRIKTCLNAIQELLRSFTKEEAQTFTEQETQTSSTPEERHRGRPDSPLEARVRQTFEALRLEERALVRAESERMLQEREGGPTDAVQSLTRLIRLTVLPNVATHTQLRALRLDEGSRPSVISRSDEPGMTATDQQIRARHKGLTEDYCRRFVAASNEEEKAELRRDIEAVRDEAQEQHFIETANVLFLFASPDQADQLAALEGMTRLIETGNPFLPEFLGLPRSNLLDVAKQVLETEELKESSPRLQRACIDLSRAVFGFLQDLSPDQDTAGSNSLRQLVVEFNIWVQAWTAAASVGVSLASKSIQDYPSPETLGHAIGIVAAIAEREDHPPHLRLRACAAECRLWIESGDHANAIAALERALSIVEALDPVQLDRSPQSDIELLRSQARELSLHAVTWKLDRLYHFFDARVAHEESRKKFDLDSYTFTHLLLLDLGLSSNSARFPSTPDNLTSEYQEFIEQRFGWWPSASSQLRGLARGCISELGIESVELETDGGKLSFLAVAQCQVNDVPRAREAYDRWVALTVANRRTWHKAISTYVNLTNGLLGCHLANGALEDFDALYGSTEVSYGGVAAYKGIFVLHERTLLHCQRGTLAPEDSARTAQDALERVIAEMATRTFPQDRAFVEMIGGSWDGMGAFSGEDFPNYRREFVARFILYTCALQRKAFPDADLGDWLTMAERLIWGQDDRARGATETLSADRFLEPIQHALCLPRAMLECLREDSGLPADLDAAKAAMDMDVEENGEGRAVYYPRRLRQ